MSHIGSIQALRAFAALLVAYGHLHNETLSMGAAGRHPAAPSGLDITAAGVDLFFVISGFVMVYASRNLFEAPGSAGFFLTRRIARIVPFYWAMTTLYLLTLMLAPNAVSKAAPTLTEIAKSYLFIPYARGTEPIMQPLYALGWTLNYEMFFYTLFALVIFLPMRTAVATIALTFSSLVIVGAWATPATDAIAFWSHPIILEFVMGAIIAVAYIEGVRLPRLQTVLLAGAGLLAVLLSSLTSLEAHASTRPLVWGLPAAAIVAAAALAIPSAKPSPRIGWAIALGNASYAIYLLHPIVIRVLRLVWDKSGAVNHLHPALFIAAGLALVIPLALAVYRWFELPVTGLAQNLLSVSPLPSVRTSPDLRRIAPRLQNSKPL